MIKHTPGPYGIYRTGDLKPVAHSIGSQTTKQTVAVLYQGPKMTDEQREANGALFVAAPELLMCCEASLVYLKLSQHLSKEELMAELERVIKKARGEP